MPADDTHTWYLDRLSAHIDGELTAGESVDVAAHLASCEACSAEYEQLMATVESMHRQLPPLRAPDALRTRIEAAVRAPNVSSGRLVPTPRSARPYRAWAAAAAMAIMLGLAYGLGARSATTAGEQMADAMLTAHVRSLQQGHLTDVVSTDQHTVKPWFTGKLDFSPAVPRLETDGFPLVGGRLDYVGNRAVAAIVYQRGAHVINVLTYPVESSAASALQIESRRGFQIARWNEGGMAYWVVSDLNVDELKAFCGLMKDGAPK
ncbi:MAG: zf-HC2 domain-containing protein [Gemmatimonadaceae bacterium]